jgi:hypothetical protein
VNLFGNPTLIGLQVRLDRPADRERPCCKNICTIGAARGPHAGELRCSGCGQHRGWLSKSTARWIEHVVTRFGAPTTPIVVRASTLEQQEATDTDPTHTEQLELQLKLAPKDANSHEKL